MRDRWASLAFAVGLGAFVAGIAAAAQGVGAGWAGAGQAAPRADRDGGVRAPAVATGYARSFDWHRPVTPGARGKSRAADRPEKLQVVGRSVWVCSPAGAGVDSRCRAR